MAETSYFWDNPGTGDSPAGGYGHDEVMAGVFRMLLNGTGDQGVLLGWLNELEVTDGGGLDAAVDTGAAITYGFFYENDAATTVTLPDNDTNYVIAKCDWTAQTVRLDYTDVLTQTAGTQWDVPLAEVTTAGGAITLITDARDYCEFSTSPVLLGVSSDMLPADSVTTAKLIDQDRWLSRGAGAFEPDATNPASWASHTTGLYRDYWEFPDAATSNFWITFRVPEDFVAGGDVTVYIYNGRPGATAGNVRWTYSAWTAAASAVLANSTGAVVVSWALNEYGWQTPKQTELAALALAAGDIVHMQIGRDGTHVNDTLTETASLFLVRVYYTADS